MLLAIDIGNTNIVLGCIETGEIKNIARISTDSRRTSHEYAAIIKSILEFDGMSIDGFEGAIISSVVLQLTHIVRDAVCILTGIKPLVVGAGIKTGLDIRLDNPAQLGSDLVVGAVAALSLLKPPMIIVDMGTATTISVLDAKGSFLGGIIYPGVGVAFSALSSGTSQLPTISIEAPKKCIGTNTIDSMKSGGVFGTASMLDGMIDRIEAEIGQKANVIATGGLANSIIPHCTHDIMYDEDLLLKGLAIIYEKNKRK